MEPENSSDVSESSAYLRPGPFKYDDRYLFYVLDTNSTIWIRANEIMEILHYGNIQDAISRHVNQDDKAYLFDLSPKFFGGNGDSLADEPNSVFLNLSAIYLLAFYSRLDNLRIFIRWMCNTVVPTIEKFNRKLQNDILEETKREFELADTQNVDLKLQNHASRFIIDQQKNDMKKYKRRIKFLEIENKAKDDVLDQQIIDARVLQNEIKVLKHEIQSLTIDNQVVNDALKKYENMPLRIQLLESEIRTKDDLLQQLTEQMKDMSRKNKRLDLTIKSKDDEMNQYFTAKINTGNRIEELEFINNTNNEELRSMQNAMSLLKNEIVLLKIQNQKTVTENQRTQDGLLHLFGRNFVPKLYNEKLEEQFLIFRLNEENFYTHYAVRTRTRNISQQIKTIQARHLHAVELLRITFYPNEINLFKLIRNHMKDKIIEFEGNFFTISSEHTDEDLKNDVLKLFNEAENMRQEVFKMMGIERYFRSNENVYESIGFADVNDNNSIPVSEITGAESNSDQDQNLDSSEISSDMTGGNSKTDPDQLNSDQNSNSAQDSEIATTVAEENLKTELDQE